MNTKSLFRFSIPAALVVAALTLTACSGGGSKKPETEEGPLQKYMSAMWDEDTFNQEYYNKKQAKTEELIAKCMAKEGFEYKPDPNNGGTMVVGPDEESDGPEWNTLKFAESYGYGTVDWPGQEDMQGGNGAGQEYVDPNQKYLDSLSDAERNAYQETLYGPPISEEEAARSGESDDGAVPTYDWKKSGCRGAADHETQDESMAAYEDPEFKDLFEKMQEMYSAVYSNGESPSTNEDLVKLDRKWSECMTDAGYDYTNSTQPRNDINEEMNKIRNSGHSEEAGAHKEPSKEDQKKMKASEKKLKEKEIKVAVADFKCRDKLNFEAEQRKVSNKLEEKFLAENKAQLDAMIAKYGTKKKDK